MDVKVLQHKLEFTKRTAAHGDVLLLCRRITTRARGVPGVLLWPCKTQMLPNFVCHVRPETLACSLSARLLAQITAGATATIRRLGEFMWVADHCLLSAWPVFLLWEIDASASRNGRSAGDPCEPDMH